MFKFALDISIMCGDTLSYKVDLIDLMVHEFFKYLQICRKWILVNIH